MPVALVVLVAVTGCGVTGNPPTTPTPTGAGTPRLSSSVPAPSPSAAHPSPSAPPTAGWSVTAAAPMLRARDGFGAVILGDGSLLVVGDDLACMPGPASPGSETAERYDPVADAWAAAAPLNKPRKDFAMVTTLDGGAMVVGGINQDDAPFSSTKRFDLAAGRWIDGPLLRMAYGHPSAVTVDDGRIYVLGPTIPGETSDTTTIEILAPGRAGWDERGRIDGVAVRSVIRLDDGRLVALGSAFESPDQVYVHDSGGAQGWLPLASPGSDFVQRIEAVRGGGVLAFASMYDPATGGTRPLNPRRHDPATDRWVETGPMIAPRTDFMAASLADGRLLVAGGVAGPRDVFDGEMVRTSEIYDPRTDMWSSGPDLLGIRYGGQAVTLKDGSVLVMGGLNTRNVGGDTPFCPGALTSVERLMPAP